MVTVIIVCMYSLRLESTNGYSIENNVYMSTLKIKYLVNTIITTRYTAKIELLKKQMYWFVQWLVYTGCCDSMIKYTCTIIIIMYNYLMLKVQRRFGYLK